ncbi:unnamed protein product [Paramecium sonneborni]|uniref:Mitogen-activated protein kinase n=1 Tax=Paramecium sonneborni TaxID=65129 RepID=A0A8S1KJN7_9CILI|nr:unnamed protein product [Paramecium sonneborni]
MSEKIDSNILKKYEIMTKIGKGAYGIVWKARDLKSQRIVALKKVFDAFSNPTDAQRTYREVSFLKQLNHPNIIQLIDTFPAENQNDLYLIFEYMETDLHIAIRAKILQPLHRRYIIYQLFKALKYIHSSGMIHRDLKPANILLDSECKIKLADFGLARMVCTLEQDILTDYVATRWFRAPEILLGSKSYSFGVDMWSIGCMIGEMILGKALFSGTSTINQLEKIIEVLGIPTSEEIQSLGGQNQLFDKYPRNYKSNLKAILNCDDDELDLIKKLLVYDPNKRISVQDALRHPYLKEFYNPKEEITFKGQLILKLQDDKQYPVSSYRDLLYKQNLDLTKILTLVNKQKSLIQNIQSNRSDALKKQSSQQQFLNQQFAKSAFMKRNSTVNIEKSVNKTATATLHNSNSKTSQNSNTSSSTQIKNKLKQICLQSADKCETVVQKKSPNSKILKQPKQIIQSNSKQQILNNVTNTSISPSQSQQRLQIIRQQHQQIQK